MPRKAPKVHGRPVALAHTKPARRRRLWRTLLIVVAVLALIRIALPYVLLHFANQRLGNMPGYYGHIDDIDLALIRGAYRIDNFFLDQQDSVTQQRTPFMAAEVIDLSVEWKALLHGSVVGELVIDRPEMRFTLDAVEPDEVQKDTADFRDLLHDFMPLKIDRVELHEGVLRYRDPGAKPPVDVQLDALEALATNLRNSYDSSEVLPAAITAEANMYGGRLDLNMRLDPLAEAPAFDLNVELEKTELVRLNDFFKAYGKFDVNKGVFGLYSEIATRDGDFKGYVKPVINDLDIVGHEDRDDNFLHQLWEVVAGAAGQVLTNIPNDQLATKVEMTGKLKDPNMSAWYAVIDLMRNAFIQAIQPAIDQEISIASVGKGVDEREGFFKKLFGSNEGKKEKPRGQEEKK